jgi:hypothetical protein
MLTAPDPSGQANGYNRTHEHARASAHARDRQKTSNRFSGPSHPPLRATFLPLFGQEALVHIYANLGRPRAHRARLQRIRTARQPGGLGQTAPPSEPWRSWRETGPGRDFPFRPLGESGGAKFPGFASSRQKFRQNGPAGVIFLIFRPVFAYFSGFWPKTATFLYFF